MDVVEKICVQRTQPGLSGNSVAIRLTSDLVDAIEKDVTAKDFEPDEIVDFQPRLSNPDGFSPFPAFRNDIWRSVVTFAMFKCLGHDEDQWARSMDTDRNLDGELFSDMMDDLLVDLDVLIHEPDEADGEDWFSLWALRGIYNVWERVKNSWSHYYLCADDDGGYLCEVDSAGNKKVVSTERR